MASASFEPLEEVVNTIHTCENDPIVTIEMIDGFVQTFVTIERADFNGGTQDYFGAVLLELDCEILRLRESARDHDGLASEWLKDSRQ